MKEFIYKFGYSIDKLSYNFISREELLAMNQKFLNHNYHTDILSFDYTKKKRLRAEFFISMSAIEQYAKKNTQSTEKETLRVVSHGVLHCMGKNDGSNQQKVEMRRLEDKFIELFHVKLQNYV